MSENRFKLFKTSILTGIATTLEEYRHPPTGARHFHLGNQDTNNAFLVALKTIPYDSSGVAHVLEHTALCGSRNYPVRDPFFMMLRRSLNSYMNAYTASDHTAYPFATQNRKDFSNLLSVYLDAVFFPLLNPLDFAQEGWRLEFNEAGTALDIGGVVFNEMKGAMSSPTARLWQQVHTTIFKDSAYRHNSGGEPSVIPSLSHDELKRFHKKHYHPSNAVFMTYGNFPCEAHQEQFERQVLGKFVERASSIPVPKQQVFKEPISATTTYAHPTDDGRDRFVVWAWMLGETSNSEEILEASFLSCLLLEHSASPLRKLFETTERATGPSELCGVDDSARQIIFICGVEGASPDSEEPLERELFECLRLLCEKGVSYDVVDAAIDRLELEKRDIGNGSYPRGLELIGRILPSVLHEADPHSALDFGPFLDALRLKVKEPDYISSLFRRLLLENPHRVRLVMRPDPKLSERERISTTQLLQGKLQELTQGEKQKIEKQNAALLDRQNTPDDPSLLPSVRITDVPVGFQLDGPARYSGSPVQVSEYEGPTNGVFRSRLAYRLPSLDAEERKVFPLWKSFLSELGSREESYLQVQERRARSGFYDVSVLVKNLPMNSDRFQGWLLLSAKGLARNRKKIVKEAASLVPLVRLDEKKRIRELVEQTRLTVEQNVSEYGHRLALRAAAAPFSASACLADLWDGPSSVKHLQHLDRAIQSDSALERLLSTFESISNKFCSRPVFASVIADAGDLVGSSKDLEDALEDIPIDSNLTENQSQAIVRDEISETRSAWLIDAQVNFSARAYAAPQFESSDAAPLAVLGNYLQDGFLHRTIRENGGAYGSGAIYDPDSTTFRFFSYRDPRLDETFEDFSHSIEWFFLDKDSARLEESILGVIRSTDQPKSLSVKADESFSHHLFEQEDNATEEFRKRVLSVTQSQLRDVCDKYLRGAKFVDCILASKENEQCLSDVGFRVKTL